MMFNVNLTRYKQQKVWKMKITTETLNKIAKTLNDMPAVPVEKLEHTKPQAIQKLSKEISAMQKRGYGLEQIAEILTKEGLQVKASTLKSYLQRAKPSQKATTANKITAPVAAPAAKTPAKLSKPVAGSKAGFVPNNDTPDI